MKNEERRMYFTLRMVGVIFILNSSFLILNLT